MHGNQHGNQNFSHTYIRAENDENIVVEIAVTEREIKTKQNWMVALCVFIALVPCAITAIYIKADIEIASWQAFVNPIDLSALLWLGVTYVSYRRTRTKRAAWLFALFPIAFVEPVLLACLWFSSAYPHQDTPRHAEALIVCPGAKQTKWVKFEGTDQLSYQIEADYPASSIVSCISAQLKEKGWRPLQEDFWNPGLPSSHVRGWTNFVDATVHPEATIDLWAAEWESEAGDIAWYSLRYVYPPGDRHTLAINAGLIPANMAKEDDQDPPAAEVT